MKLWPALAPAVWLNLVVAANFDVRSDCFVGGIRT